MTISLLPGQSSPLGATVCPNGVNFSLFSKNAQDVPQAGLENYWGYNTIGFFAPHNAYSSNRDRLGAINEFRDMVKALHRAGIEVILDVVYNHTAEGNEQGATLSFRGLDNDIYLLKNGIEFWIHFFPVLKIFRI